MLQSVYSILIGERLPKGRILQVEENPDYIEKVRFLLEHAGYPILEEYNRKKVLDPSQQELPDLILMNLSLPVVDWWTAAHKLKADPKMTSIPLLGFTDHPLPRDRSQVFDPGFDGIDSKPINIQSYSVNIVQALRVKKRSKKVDLSDGNLCAQP